VPEVIRDGVGGILVSSMDEAVEAVSRIGALSRPGVRRYFESRFTAGRMAADYVRAYETLIARSRPRNLMLVAAE
jgi:glycosyltransferase involved in cell wall biosynthesis